MLALGLKQDGVLGSIPYEPDMEHIRDVRIMLGVIRESSKGYLLLHNFPHMNEVRY